MRPTRRGCPVTRLHHVGLTVSDLEVSIEFYCAVLGCILRERSESGGSDLEALTGVAGAHMLTADLELETGDILELIQYLAPEGGRSDPAEISAGPHAYRLPGR